MKCEKPFREEHTNLRALPLQMKAYRKALTITPIFFHKKRPLKAAFSVSYIKQSVRWRLCRRRGRRWRSCGRCTLRLRAVDVVEIAEEGRIW